MAWIFGGARTLVLLAQDITVVSKAGYDLRGRISAGVYRKKLPLRRQPSSLAWIKRHTSRCERICMTYSALV